MSARSVRLFRLSGNSHLRSVCCPFPTQSQELLKETIMLFRVKTEVHSKINLDKPARLFGLGCLSFPGNSFHWYALCRLGEPCTNFQAEALQHHAFAPTAFVCGGQSAPGSA